MSDYFFIVSEHNHDLVLDVPQNSGTAPTHFGHNYVGHWIGTYPNPGGHNEVEVINVELTNGQLVATKVTGDQFVPAGQITWRATLNSATAGNGEGQVAGAGFSNPKFISGHFAAQNDNQISFTWTGSSPITYTRAPGYTQHHVSTHNQGAKLTVWAYHGGENQRFRFDEKGNISSVLTGQVLDAEGGAKEGARIIQWPAHGGENQRWKWHKDGTIRLENHNLVLDIAGGSTEQGANVIAWSHTGNSNQKWRIVTKWHH